MKMRDFELKINSLNWFQAMGLEYYCSTNKDHRRLREKFFSEIKPAATTQNLVVAPSINSNTKLEASSMQKTLIKNENSIVSQARKLAESATTIAELKEIVMNFDGCNLKKMAQSTVFCDGNPSAPYMFIGEAPGATEDKMGIPFCGESGKLLDNILASIDVSRKTNAYITNTVFWRPPANRAPTPEEIDICRPFVEKHIALASPKMIILVGSTAATSLLGKHAGITKIRQEYYSYSNQYLRSPITTTAIFHPAYLLRQPMQKKTTWYDLLKIKQYVVDNKILESLS